VQDQAVAKRQLIGIDHDGIGILDDGVAGNAPALVADDPLTVFTWSLRVDLIAVMPTGRGIREHFGPPNLTFQEIPRSQPDSSAELLERSLFLGGSGLNFACHVSV
jgi:hypothetical protein